MTDRSFSSSWPLMSSPSSSDLSVLHSISVQRRPCGRTIIRRRRSRPGVQSHHDPSLLITKNYYYALFCVLVILASSSCCMTKAMQIHEAESNRQQAPQQQQQKQLRSQYSTNEITNDFHVLEDDEHADFCPRGRPAALLHTAVYNNNNDDHFKIQQNPEFLETDFHFTRSDLSLFENNERAQVLIDGAPIRFHPGTPPQINISKQEIHRITLQQLASSSLFPKDETSQETRPADNDGFHGFLFRVQRSTNKNNSNMTQVIRHWNSELARISPFCDNRQGSGEITGITHAALVPKSSVSVDLYFENEDHGIPVDITIMFMEERDSSGEKQTTRTIHYSYYHASILLNVVNDATPRAITSSGQVIQSSLQQRNLQDTPTIAPATSSTMPTVAAPQVMTVAPSAMPSESLSPSSIATDPPSNMPSPVSSFPSSILPSSTPSLEPSFPLSDVPSVQPSWTPSSTPSHVPSSGPTALDLSLAPSGIPTAVPSEQPSTTTTNPIDTTTARTAFPTGSPSSSSGFVISTRVDGIQLTLQNVAKLDEIAKLGFEQEMDAWYLSTFDDMIVRRLGRQLEQHAKIQEVQISTYFVDQNPSSTDNVITYDQLVAFRTRDDDDADLFQILSEPFEDEALNFFLRQRLQRVATAFDGIPIDTAIQAPTFPVSTSASVEEIYFDYPFVIGVGAGGAAVIAILLVYVFKGILNRRRRKFTSYRPTDVLLIPTNSYNFDATEQDDDEHYSMDEEEDIRKPFAGHVIVRNVPTPSNSVSLSSNQKLERSPPSLGQTKVVPPNPGDSFRYGGYNYSPSDFDYAKAYGAADDMADHSITSSVSSRSRNKSSFCTEGSLGIEYGKSNALGPALYVEEDTDDFYANVNQHLTEDSFAESEILTVEAPPGRLGVVIDTPNNGPPIVYALKDTSVLADQIHVGDKLIQVDDEDVTKMTAVKVSRLISQKANNKVRRLTLRRIVVES